MKEIAVISKTKGLDLRKDSATFSYSETGYEFLQALVNADVTDGNLLVRRNGYEVVLPVSFGHSLVSHLRDLYFASEGNIYAFAPGESPRLVRTNVGGEIAWLSLGDKLFYTDGVSTGFIHDYTDYAWKPGPYVGPENTRDRSAPPPGTCLSYFRGRIFIGAGKTIWFTNPMEPFVVDKARNFISMEEPVVGLASTDSLLVIGTTEGVYLLSGAESKEFSLAKVSNSAMIAGTEIEVLYVNVLGKPVTGKSVIYTATDGIYVVTPDGSVIDITQERLCLPNTAKGSAMYYRGFYTVLIDE